MGQKSLRAKQRLGIGDQTLVVRLAELYALRKLVQMTEKSLKAVESKDPDYLARVKSRKHLEAGARFQN